MLLPGGSYHLRLSGLGGASFAFPGLVAILT